MAKAGRPAAGVRQNAVLHDLQQQIAHIRVSLFDLVEQHYAIRSPANPFAEHAAVLKSHISGRSTDQLGNGMLFHEFRHVNTNQAFLVVKEVCCQSTCQSRFSHAGGTCKKKCPDGTGLVL